MRHSRGRRSERYSAVEQIVGFDAAGTGRQLRIWADTSNEVVSRRMSVRRRRDTDCELRVRSVHHSQGMRYSERRRPL
jgi:hypothetical protein